MKTTPVSLTDWRVAPAESPAPSLAGLLDAAARKRRRRLARLGATVSILAVAAIVGGVAGYGRSHESDEARRARLFEAHVATLISPGASR